MKLILLGGFLGSGKTSVLLPLARHIAGLPGGGTKLAIIENEIGDVGVDALAAEHAGFTVKNMFSGCICCTLAGDLVSGMREIEAAYNPAWLLIETTGLAFPDKIIATIRQYLPGCEGLVAVTVVDAERWEELSGALGPLMKSQVASAEMVLLNKTDLVGEEQRRAIATELTAINPHAKLWEICAKEPLCADLFHAILEGGRRDV